MPALLSPGRTLDFMLRRCLGIGLTFPCDLKGCSDVWKASPPNGGEFRSGNVTVGNPGVLSVKSKEAHSRPCHATFADVLVPRAGAIRDTAGMINMVADRDTEEVLGVSVVGNSAGEVIHEAAMAMRFHAKISDFIDLLHVYPTMAEALKIVAISRRKDPAKLSCCAE